MVGVDAEGVERHAKSSHTAVSKSSQWANANASVLNIFSSTRPVNFCIVADTLQVPAVTIGYIRFLLYASEEKWFVVEPSAFDSAVWVAEAHFL
jgi:hypothetical protein